MTIRLRARELDVWSLIRLHKKETAAALGISEATVSQYRSTLYAELGVDSAVDAALLGVACGIIPVGYGRPVEVIRARKRRS